MQVACQLSGQTSWNGTCYMQIINYCFKSGKCCLLVGEGGLGWHVAKGRNQPVSVFSLTNCNTPVADSENMHNFSYMHLI